MTTATAVAWDAEREQELASTLAVLTRTADYSIEHQWDAEIEGVDNPLWDGSGEIPGADEGSDEWHKAAKIRSWWQFLRIESGLNTRQAADELDVATSTLVRWENGERTPKASKPRYQRWLEEKRAELIDHYTNRIIDLATLRDGWPAPPSGVERHALLGEFTRVGGWWDQWRRTGTLPNTRR